MNNRPKVENGIVTQSDNPIHRFRGKDGDFGRILSQLRNEIENLKTIRSRYFWNDDRSLIV